MLTAYRATERGLEPLPKEAGVAGAVWVDVFCPTADETVRMAAAGVALPSLADMEEIEVSNRLYRDGETEVLTVTLPGQDAAGQLTLGPVAFLLMSERLVTLRYHAPRPFETYPTRATSLSAGWQGRRRVMLGLTEDIIARLADLLEAVGKALDAQSRGLFPETGPRSAELAAGLQALGRQGEQISRLRLALVSLERALSAFGLNLEGKDGAMLRQVHKAQLHDIQALNEHGDFLAGRLAQLTDVTMGLINLDQNRASRVLSVVALLFLLPTLVASIFGMNFVNLPGIHRTDGYLIAAGFMVASVAISYLVARLRKWM